MDNAVFHSTVRVFFKKEGRIKYISHLDLTRTFERALRRSGIPVWYTMGFNPHIYMTFALPLSLGYEGLCESIDFRLLKAVPEKELLAKLQAVLPEGLTVYKAQEPKQKPQDIAWADYKIIQEFDTRSAGEVCDAFLAFCESKQVEVEKRTKKKGVQTIDIRPHFSLVGEPTVMDNRFAITLRTAAGITLNINPSLVLDAFAAKTGITADWTRVIRTSILDKDLNHFA